MQATEEAFNEVLQDFPPMEWQVLYDHCDQQQLHTPNIPIQAQSTTAQVPSPLPSTPEQPTRWYDAMIAQTQPPFQQQSQPLQPPSIPLGPMGQVDAEWHDTRTGLYSSFGKVRPVPVSSIPFESFPPSAAISKKRKKDPNDPSRKKRKLDPQLVKTMADHLTGTAGLEKIRWQSILQNTRGSEVGERETQRRVKEVEILWLRLFGGDLRDLMRNVLDQHLEFVVKYVRETLCTSKRRHKKVRENLFRVLLDVKRREEYEASRKLLLAATVPGGSSRVPMTAGGMVGPESYGLSAGYCGMNGTTWYAPPTPELGEHSDG